MYTRCESTASNLTLPPHSSPPPAPRSTLAPRLSLQALYGRPLFRGRSADEIERNIVTQELTFGTVNAALAPISQSAINFLSVRGGPRSSSPFGSSLLRARMRRRAAPLWREVPPLPPLPIPWRHDPRSRLSYRAISPSRQTFPPSPTIPPVQHCLVRNSKNRLTADQLLEKSWVARPAEPSRVHRSSTLPAVCHVHVTTYQRDSAAGVLPSEKSACGAVAGSADSSGSPVSAVGTPRMDTASAARQPSTPPAREVSREPAAPAGSSNTRGGHSSMTSSEGSLGELRKDVTTTCGVTWRDVPAPPVPVAPPVAALPGPPADRRPGENPPLAAGLAPLELARRIRTTPMPYTASMPRLNSPIESAQSPSLLNGRATPQSPTDARCKRSALSPTCGGQSGSHGRFVIGAGSSSDDADGELVDFAMGASGERAGGVFLEAAAQSLAGGAVARPHQSASVSLPTTPARAGTRGDARGSGGHHRPSRLSGGRSSASRAVALNAAAGPPAPVPLRPFECQSAAADGGGGGGSPCNEKVAAELPMRRKKSWLDISGFTSAVCRIFGVGSFPGATAA